MARLGTKLFCAAMLAGLAAIVQAGSTQPASAQVACCFGGNDNCCDNVSDDAKKTLSPTDQKRLATRLDAIHKQRSMSTPTPGK